MTALVLGREQKRMILPLSQSASYHNPTATVSQLDHDDDDDSSESQPPPSSPLRRRSCDNLSIQCSRQEQQYQSLEIGAHESLSSQNHLPHQGCHQHRPLPLRDPYTYMMLIQHLYLSSGTIIFSNMLEWLDFGIYGYSEHEISLQLFGGNTAAGWATFGLGYLFRPIGAYHLGRIADQHSRKVSLMIAVFGMTISTATMALLPANCNRMDDKHDYIAFSSYCINGSSWKTALPTILLRCIQGFSAGGAAGGVNVIQSEIWTATPTKRGALAQSVGVNNVSGSTASMLSAGIVYGLRAWIGPLNYAVWGWRLAFLIVVPPSVFASLSLCRMENSNEEDHHNESVHHSSLLTNGTSSVINPDSDNDENVVTEDAFQDEPIAMKKEKKNDDSAGVVTEIDKHIDEAPPKTSTDGGVPYWLLISLSIFIQFAIASYNNLNIYMVQYAKQNYGLSTESATLMAAIGKAVQLLMTPFAALLGDIYGWFGACSIGGILCTLLAIPMMSLNQFIGLCNGNDNADRESSSNGDVLLWILISGIFPFVSTIWILNAPLLATSIFPTETRSQGTSLVMAMGTAVAGFFPLLLNQMDGSSSSNSSNGNSASSMYTSGIVLASVAALGTISILWIRSRAHIGRIQIYQRVELF